MRNAFYTGISHTFYRYFNEKRLFLIRFSMISHTLLIVLSCISHALLIEIARMMGTVNAYIENR